MAVVVSIVLLRPFSLIWIRICGGIRGCIVGPFRLRSWWRRGSSWLIGHQICVLRPFVSILRLLQILRLSRWSWLEAISRPVARKKRGIVDEIISKPTVLRCNFGSILHFQNYFTFTQYSLFPAKLATLSIILNLNLTDAVKIANGGPN